MSRPWGINALANMISGPGLESSRDGVLWERAVPVPYRKNWRETIRAAWWVVTGKAEAVVWPDAGEYDRLIAEERREERNRCAAIAQRHLDRIPGHCPDQKTADLVAQGYGNAALNILHEIAGPGFSAPPTPSRARQTEEARS